MAGGVAALFGDRKQQVFGRDEFVLEAASLIESAFQDLVQRRRQIHPGLHAAGLRHLAEQPVGFGDDRVGMDAALLQHPADDALLLFGQGDQQVEWKHHLIFIFFGNGLALLHGFLRFLGQLIQTKH